ncbi:MAG: NCS2 family permease [Phycisphaerae bacterium]|nr:NCS2 family permease [Phycisphaerae bacterium]
MFDIAARGSTVTREIIGGVSTFMALSYIIFVNPVILSAAGMLAPQVMLATCLGAAVGCVLMALLANYPIAQAPAMGHNAYFAFTVCGAVTAGGLGLTWQQALAAVVISGSLFVVLSVFGFRSAILNSIPDALKKSIAAGIGLLIALIGLEYGGIIVAQPATLVTLGTLTHPVPLCALGGLVIIMVLTAWRVRGAILLGIVATAGLALAFIPEVHAPTGVFSHPPSLRPTLFKLDFAGLFHRNWLDLASLIFVLFFLDVFDSVGTLVGVAQRGGFLTPDGKLPRAERALLADAGATVIGACLGTSTVSSYIESTAGVSDGARTGLANLVTAALLVLSIFFTPLAGMIGGAVVVKGQPFYPIIAPALIAVGSMMVLVVRDIAWDDPAEALPAFLTMTIIPFSFSISDGIAFGFIAYAAAKLLTGRPGRCPPLVYLFAALFVLRYALPALVK